MTERWRRELEKLSDLGPDHALQERARGATPRADAPTRSRGITIAVAFAVFIAGAFAWMAFDRDSSVRTPTVPADGPSSEGYHIELPVSGVAVGEADTEVTALTDLPNGTLVNIEIAQVQEAAAREGNLRLALRSPLLRHPT